VNQGPDTVDTGQTEALLQEIAGKLDTVITHLQQMQEIVSGTQSWVMLLFFLCSIGFGIPIGYLIGKR
jgi:hypothetical protein